MAFPTPQNSPTVPPVQKPVEVNQDYKLRNFNNLDDLISELNIERQKIDATPPPAPAPGHPAPDVQVPPGSGAPAAPWENAPDPITREDAERAGRRAAVMADSVLSVAAMMVAKEQNPDKYKASEGEIKDLSDAWSEVSQEYSFKINPWFNVAILTLMVYMPYMMEAANDRRFKTLQEEQKKQAEKIAEIQEQLKNQETK